MKTFQASILVVDDVPDNIDILLEVLKYNYKVLVARGGETALKIACSESPPDLILLDVMMPEMDGFEVCQRLKSDTRTRDIPVIFVTAMGEVEDESRGFEVGAVDYLTKPISPSVVRSRVKTHLNLNNQRRHLETAVVERTRELDETRLEIIRRLGRAAEYKDNETGRHVIRMSHYSRHIAEEAGLSAREVEMIFNAAPMHDIGKIGIPDNILLKPGKLDDEEWKIMKLHPAYGAEIIGTHSSLLLTSALRIAIDHHEKWNGSGYPDGKTGEKIDLFARIVAIADVYDALTSIRPYKPAWEPGKALKLIQKEAGSHFDPRFVSAFLKRADKCEEVRIRWSD